MTPTPHPPDSSIEEQASLWAARLEGETMGAADHAALESWLAADPAHRNALSAYCQFSAELEQLLPHFVAAGTVELPAAAPRSRGNRRVVRPLAWLLGGGVALAAAAAVMVAVFRPAPVDPVARYATTVAQRESLRLEDGTTVELNALTTLVSRSTARERRVHLAGGQAFFNVAKDPARPFIVETPAGAVRVTGTAFDVRLAADARIEVTVLEGAVQVRLGANDHHAAVAPHALAAGDQLSTFEGPARLRHLSDRAVAKALAWREGHLELDDVPLRDVLTRFAHYHGRGLSAAPGAAELTLSGRYPLDDLEAFWVALEAVLPVQVLHDPSGTTRVQPRP